MLLCGCSRKNLNDFVSVSRSRSVVRNGELTRAYNWKILIEEWHLRL